MAFCTSCGQEIGSASFCPNCGTNQGATPMAVSSKSTSEGLAENIAGLLCYLCGWLTGIIFLLVDKRPWVRFQAAQSIVVFGGLTIIRIGLGIMSGGLVGFGLLGLLRMIIGLVGLVLWILLMVKAYKHETFRVPYAADLADSIAAK